MESKSCETIHFKTFVIPMIDHVTYVSDSETKFSLPRLRKRFDVLHKAGPDAGTNDTG